MKILITEAQYNKIKLLKEDLNINKFVGTNIYPEDYDYVGAAVLIDFDSNGEKYLEPVDDGYDYDVRVAILKNDKEKCAICNKSITNRTLFKNKNNDEYIFVGFDCAKSILKFAFDAKDAKKMGLRNRITTDRLKKIQDILTVNPNLDLWLSANHKIAKSLRDQLYSKGTLSAAQISLAEKIYNERNKFEKESNKVDLGGDSKYNGDFEVLNISAKPTEIRSYGYKSTTTKEGVIYVTLKHKDGWKIYGSLGIAPTVTFYRPDRYVDYEKTQLKDDYKKFNDSKEIVFKWENGETAKWLDNDLLKNLSYQNFSEEEKQKEIAKIHELFKRQYEEALKYIEEFVSEEKNKIQILDIRFNSENNQVQEKNIENIISFLGEEFIEKCKSEIIQNNRYDINSIYSAIFINDLLEPKLKGKNINITAKNIKVSPTDEYMAFSNLILLNNIS
jgi:hypothetical protein